MMLGVARGGLPQGVFCVTRLLKRLQSYRGVSGSWQGTGTRAMVDLHEQSIYQTPYNLDVVPQIALNLITSMLQQQYYELK